MTKHVRLTLTVAAAIVAATAALAQTKEAAPAQAQGGGDASELAKQLSNPIASLVSVPFQANWDFSVGPDNDTRFLVNFQPVMPFSINKDWNLIARVIVPILSQPSLVAGGEATFGLSDLLFSAFFSPAQPGKFIWGVGPALLLPTTSDPFLGTEKWAIGPTYVILKQSGPWTYGGLANRLWSFAGDDNRADVNQTYVQPFLAYGTKTGVTYNVSSETAANWEAPSGEEWTVPIVFNVSKVLRLGRRPLSVGVGAGYYFDQPQGGPEWKFRSTLTLIFPK